MISERQVLGDILRKEGKHKWTQVIEQVWTPTDSHPLASSGLCYCWHNTILKSAIYP